MNFALHLGDQTNIQNKKFTETEELFDHRTWKLINYLTHCGRFGYQNFVRKLEVLELVHSL